MTRYFKVNSDTPLWKKNCIITNVKNPKEYHSMLEIWDTTNLRGEYLSSHLVESLPQWFTEVKPTLDKTGNLIFSEIKKDSN